MRADFRLYFLFFLLLLLNTANAETFEMVQFGERADKCSVFIPEVKPDTCEVVLFLHGHGASNALVYGSWIKHLLDQGKVVVFPKYQTGWFIPMVNWSQKRASEALLKALTYLTLDRKLKLKKIHVIGHSLGGAIGANIVATTRLPAPLQFASLALIEPGCWLFKSGRLKSYASFPDNLRLMCITGRGDVIAGKRMASYVMRHSPGLPDSSKVHFQVISCFHKGQSVRSTHLEPAGVDSEMDTHNRNLFIRSARYVCPTNLTDEAAFWRPIDRMMNEKQPVRQCGNLGSWKDGTAIGSLKILQD